jgi:TolB-like protein/Flp pilus assembly protein TadD
VNVRSFFTELKRRHVYKVAIAYGVVAWLLMQVASQIFPFFEIPNWAVRLVVLLLIIGFPVALILAWAFELTPEGIKRTEDADAGPVKHAKHRAWIYVVVIAGALSVGLFFLGRYTAPNKQSRSSEVATKSIAVLPFEYLSEDKANAYFADGIQDEILTRLSKIADLKVISRTSTQKYRSAPNNLREIAQQLGVTNVLEGSVQKAADQVRVSVQLINAINDSHIWAESYDRKLIDVFQVESDVAQKIAGSLEAKLTGREKSDISSAATKVPEAYEAYLRGVVVYREGNYDSLYRSLTNFSEAVRLDPNFALAWALLARMQSDAYTQRESTEARAEAARTALEAALRLQPDLPEAQMAEGFYEEWVVQDYGKARVKFEQLHSRWRNNDEIAEALGIIAEHQGRWQDARAYLDEAIALNPRDPDPRKEAARIRLATRDFPAALQVLDKALSIWPDITDFIAIKARVCQGMGELDQAEALLSRLHPRTKDQSAVLTVWYQAILRREYPEAIAVCRTVLDPANSLPHWLHSVCLLALGELQRFSGDTVEARASNKQSIHELDEQMKGLSDNASPAIIGPASLPYALAMLAQAHANLNEREAALQAIDRAIQLAPVSKDARSNFFEEIRARIQARFGDKEHAIPALEHLLAISYSGAYGPPLTPALLRLDPYFDEIRSDSRFQELCKEKQP